MSALIDRAPIWQAAKWTILDCCRISIVSIGVIVLSQPLYSWLHDGIMGIQTSDRYFIIAATMLIHETLYYGFNYALWLYSKTNNAQPYRIPRQEHQQPTSALIAKTLRQSFFSHWFLQPLSLYLLYPIFQRNNSMTVEPMNMNVNSLAVVAMQLVVSILINDALFYWSHRLLHHKLLYKRFHKQHHEYNGTIGIAAEYASPLEQLLSNQGPTILGPILTGMHLHVWMVYLAWRLWRTYETHSGLSFRNTWLGRLGLLHGHGALYHDFHHTNNRGNYGGPANAFWDVLCGTMDPSYLQHLSKMNARPYYSWM
eukprot:TRINITY_DN6406_c0_g1_i2.p1 TRINITY_DN6406_c0_g1~~TRINITY_DN6406_c0_g1_i2.p1  ORF type:complete len:341 (+),score=45.10 TRINITY_DN6406_c0_g1_i2:90-1025(+)